MLRYTTELLVKISSCLVRFIQFLILSHDVQECLLQVEVAIQLKIVNHVLQDVGP